MNDAITQADIEIGARTVYIEARGEPYEGKLAVAHVFINRWKSKDGQFAKDDTLATACLRHKQFSGWNEGDPNFRKGIFAHVSDPLFRECWRAVLEALDGEDMTEGSLHYFTFDVRPIWARGHDPVFKTEGHLFFNDIE